MNHLSRPNPLTGPMRFRLVAPMVITTVAALALAPAASGMATPTQFTSTGHQQVYIVPSGVMLAGVVAEGGFGGSTNPQPPASNNIAAYGAFLQGYLATKPGQKLYVEVGQNGTSGGGATFGRGGAAGGPPPGVPDCTLSGSDMDVPCDGPWAGSGGGASDVRTCSELAASCPGGGTSAKSRLIVAAGGGGAGGGGLTGNGAGCDNGADVGGEGQNNQLPTASPAGPAAIKTAAGIVIPGFAGGNQTSVTTTDGSTNAAMGTTAAGEGGTRTGCSVNTVSYSGAVAGSSGSGPDGGAGGSASALSPCCGSPSFAPGGGGGGGGGYFGGGGGATGMGSCSGMSCNGNGGTGQGGAAGSSFFSNAIKYPSFTFTGSDVYIEFWPVIEIDTPANGAVYTSGQVVDASWECDSYSGGPGGCNNSSATVASGGPIDTSPGTHTFTVRAKVNATGNGSQPATATVTYTVLAAAKITKHVISSKHHTAQFMFSAAGARGFQCALLKPTGKPDKAKPTYSSCTSPKTYRQLKPGSYTFFVRPVSGRTVGKAASDSFKIA